jgi:hypothetical protein
LRYKNERNKVFAVSGSLLFLGVFFVQLLGLSSNVELEVENISITDFVCLTILFIETFTFNCVLTAVLDKVVEFHSISTDESSFEITVDNSSSLGGLPSFTDSPAFDLISSSSEEMDELKSFVTNIGDLRDHGGSAFLNFVSSSVTGFELGRASIL